MTGRGTFEHGSVGAAAAASIRPTTSVSPRVRARCWRAARRVRSRLATTRSSPRGTAWRSPRWPRRRWRLNASRIARARQPMRRFARLDRHMVDGRLRRASLGRPGRRAARLPRRPRRVGHCAADAVPGHRRRQVARICLAAVGRRTRAFHRSRPRGSVVRHRRRCRAVDGAAVRSRRRSDAVRGGVDRRSAATGRAPGACVDRYAAAETLLAATPILAKQPRSGGHWLAVAEAAVRGPIQVAVACDPADSELLAAARPWRRAEPSWSEERPTRRNCSSDATASAAAMPPTYAAAGVRPARNDRRRSRYRAWRGRVACGHMPSAELITQTVNRYWGWSPQAPRTTSSSCTPRTRLVEDPVGGGEAHIGRQAITGFYKTSRRWAASGIARAAGRWTRGGLHVRAHRDRSVTPRCGSTHGVMAFDGEGKITAMKAYWGPENITQL